MKKITGLTDKDECFYSPTKGQLSGDQLLLEIVDFVKNEPKEFYSLIIGSDSHTKRLDDGPAINFVTAIVVHRHGYGGRYFWRRIKEFRRYGLREKIYRETLFSLEIAMNLVPKLRLALEPSCYELEIHVDVGDFGPTRELIKEVVGMVNGNGFTAKTKPESYGAFVVADKHT